MAANKETVCSFQEIVGGHCGFQTKDRRESVEVLPLLQCKRNIGAHKSALALTGVENKVDLILYDDLILQGYYKTLYVITAKKIK